MESHSGNQSLDVMMTKLNKSEWISICIEGSPVKDVVKLVKVAESIQSILNDLDKDYVIGSYPGWLIHLLY